MSSTATGQKSPSVPQRPYGSIVDTTPQIPASVSIVGLGCSSFSTFFWTEQEQALSDDWSVRKIDKAHPRVQEWIRTIAYAVTVAGINVLDTAPWYGHGTSEVVIGWAMDDETVRALRSQLFINTKVGRYDADPTRQFDFTEEATFASVERSLQRLRCVGYVDVLQLHDPEFAPSLDILFKETIPAMLKCQARGMCRALGMTGTPDTSRSVHSLYHAETQSLSDTPIPARHRVSFGSPASNLTAILCGIRTEYLVPGPHVRPLQLARYEFDQSPHWWSRFVPGLLFRNECRVNGSSSTIHGVTDVQWATHLASGVG
jgi:Aldo/keto reductase family